MSQRMDRILKFKMEMLSNGVGSICKGKKNDIVYSWTSLF